MEEITEIESVLDEEYLSALNALKTSNNYESDEFKEMVEYAKIISKLRLDEKKLIIEQDKNNSDIEMLGEKLENESEIQNMRFKEEKFIKRISLGIELAAVVFPLFVYSKFVDKGFVLERDGTYTSVTLKSILQKFRPTK